MQNPQSTISVRSPTDAGLSRLMRDIAECMRDPVDGIQLFVHENDARHMCAVLTPVDEAYVGIRLHLSISIPQDYPSASPQISIDTPIPHPNIFGNYICCSILKGRLVQNPATGEVSGYTPAYPLQTILLQLLSFFTADAVDQDYDWNDTWSIKRERQTLDKLRECVSGFSCKHCGYGAPSGFQSCNKCGAKRRASPPGASSARRMRDAGVCHACGAKRPYDSTATIFSFYQTTSEPRGPLGAVSTRHVRTVAGGRKTRETKAPTQCVLDRLLPDIWQLIILRLRTKDIAALATAYPQLRRSVNIDSIIIRRNLRCFYLRSDFNEAVLGVGVQVDRVGGKAQFKYSSSFDILSSFAFQKSGIRESPWGHTFSHFLPLAISQRHFERARRDIEAAVMALNGRAAAPFDPALIVPTFARWMNQMVVDLMRDVLQTQTTGASQSKPAAGAKPLLHASDKALTGYCALLHLLLVLAQTHPQILPAVYSKVNGFLSSPTLRHKRHVPDLGELLVCLALVPGLSWEAVATPLLDELLTRNVVWVLNAHPHLAYIEPDDTISRRRLNETFSATITGKRLFLFQVRFLKDLIWSSSTVCEDLDKPAVATEPSLEQPRQPSVSDRFAGRTTAPFVESDSPATATMAPTRLSFAAVAASATTQGPAANITDTNDGGAWIKVVRKNRIATALPPFDRRRAAAHIAALLAASDATFGLPTPARAAALAAYARAVLRIDGFPAFFDLLAGGHASASSSAPTTTTTPAATPRPLLVVCRALRTAVERSETAGYHRLPYTPAELWMLRRAVEPAAVVAASLPAGRPAPRALNGARRSFFPDANNATVRRRGGGGVGDGSPRTRNQLTPGRPVCPICGRQDSEVCLAEDDSVVPHEAVAVIKYVFAAERPGRPTVDVKATATPSAA